ncbi:F-box/kelch-repeat protein At3g06240 [Lactuca sativa]|nr:F-box/kelch-repeat protein At3g06240 [Lactuca sativa]
MKCGADVAPTTYVVCGGYNGWSYGLRNRFVVHIWNPSISDVSTLPRYSMPSICDDPIRILFRFGFDPKTDDYKVVKLASFLQPPSFMDPIVAAILGTNFFVVKEWLQVEVYSMRKGSWKGKEQTIVAFDLGLETFCEIPVPDFVRDFSLYKRFNALGVLGGKLCVMSCVEDGECEVWVMDEYGVAESWVKHHVFSQFSGDIDPYGFTLHNEFLFNAYKSHLALYDPNAATVKTFKIAWFKVLGVAKIVNYVDSLVWVAPGECETRASLDCISEKKHQ